MRMKRKCGARCGAMKYSEIVRYFCIGYPHQNWESIMYFFYNIYGGKVYDDIRELTEDLIMQTLPAYDDNYRKFYVRYIRIYKEHGND